MQSMIIVRLFVCLCVFFAWGINVTNTRYPFRKRPLGCRLLVLESGVKGQEIDG